MPAAPLPLDEPERLRALQRLGVLDTAPEAEYDDLVAMAAQLCGTDVGVLSLLDADRQWFKATRGLGDLRETPRDVAFCAHAILGDGPLVVPDATHDRRFADNPLVTGQPGIRFYAGAPVVTDEGYGLGTVCVLGPEPRELSDVQQDGLVRLSRVASRLLQQARTAVAFQAALASVGHAVVDLAADLTVLSINGGWERFGCGPAENVVGRRLVDLVHPADRSALVTALARTSASEHRLDVRLAGLDGGQRHVEVSLMGLHEDGRCLGYVGTVADLSQRLHREVEERHAQKLEALGRMSAGLAHEINTPIQFVGDNTRFLADACSSLLGLVGSYRAALVADDQLPWETRRRALLEAETRADIDYLTEEVPSAVTQSLDGIERVASLVKAMKAFSYKDGEELQYADLNEAVESTVVVSRNETKYVADVVVELGQLPPLPCHIGDLKQVLLNLLVNAADAVAETGRRGRITVTTGVREGMACVQVSDDGCGMPEDVLAHAFDPFFTTKPVGRGTGQGLALTAAVVRDRHHGRVEVDSAVGTGTTFRLLLPLTAAAAPASAA